MSFVEILKVIVLGIVEGFTEWLPISSTGHMILVDEIIHLDVSEAYREVFMVVIQLGAILAVMVLYFNKLNPFSPHKSMAQKRGTIRLWIKIIIACIPAAVIGLPLDHFMDKLMNGYVVAAMLILYGVLFIVLENRNVHRHFPIERVTQISFQTAALKSASRAQSENDGDADFVPDSGTDRLFPGAGDDSGYFPFGRDDSGRDADRLFTSGGGRIFILPWDSGYVRCEFFKDCEIFHSGRRIFFRGVHLSGSWYGGRIWRVRVLDQVPDGICPQA